MLQHDRASRFLLRCGNAARSSLPALVHSGLGLCSQPALASALPVGEESAAGEQEDSESLLFAASTLWRRCRHPELPGIPQKKRSDC